MKVRITHVKLASNTDSEDRIVAVRWRNDATGEEGTATVPLMIDWLERMSGEAVVGKGDAKARVDVVRARDRPAFLRTRPDDRDQNNLLSLPRF